MNAANSKPFRDRNVLYPIVDEDGGRRVDVVAFQKNAEDFSSGFIVPSKPEMTSPLNSSRNVNRSRANWPGLGGPVAQRA